MRTPLPVAASWGIDLCPRIRVLAYVLFVVRRGDPQGRRMIAFSGQIQDMQIIESAEMHALIARAGSPVVLC